MAVPGITQQAKAKDSLAARKDDFYPTPPTATERLLSVEQFDGAIWEPACGDGAVVDVLRAHGHTVVATDLVDRGLEGRVDFLMEWRPLAPNVITNPPYKLADQFANRALQLSTGKIAFLLRLVWLAGQRRRPIVEQLARVWVFSGRLPRMHRDGWDGPRSESSAIDFAWFIWERGHVGKPTLGWL